MSQRVALPQVQYKYIIFFAKTGSKFLVLAFRGPEIRYAILVPVSILFINFI